MSGYIGGPVLSDPIATWCPVSWERPSDQDADPKPCYCDLDVGHDGPHHCCCGYVLPRSSREVLA